VNTTATLCALLALSGTGHQDPAEPVVLVPLLDNGREPESARAPGAEVERIPWWLASEGAGVIAVDSEHWLSTPGESTLRQPIAAYAPLAGDLVVRGRVRGQGAVSLIDGAGGAARVEVGASGDEAQAFEVHGSDFAAALGRAPVPGFTLELRSAGPGSDGLAIWRDLEVHVPLPCPDEAALRAEIVAHLERVFAEWLARGIDDVGPRPTTYLCHRIDAVTGARLATGSGGLMSVYVEMLAANALAPHPAWEAALAAHLEDFLTLGIYPGTGLPREWDCEQDLPSDAKPVEIARYIGFLIDAAESGPSAYRERALAAALRMGATVLAHGVLPDGGVAAKYLPRDATPQLDVPPLRRLDVPAQLARLGALSGDARLTAAARAALGELEYTLFWGGVWHTIDPDFDDNFGHWGERALTMLETHPGDPVFDYLPRSGFEHFEPLWRDALRFGGSIAADQVRCWRIVARYARLRPELAERTRALLAPAVRAHFKGEQYGNGAWGDVTFKDWGTRDLPVGDLPGVPANLLEGLGFLYGEDCGLERDVLRALYTAVLRSSEAAYRREHGWLMTRSEVAGSNLAGGEVRLLAGWIEMLRHLTR
jgi:hypothetical protein